MNIQLRVVAKSFAILIAFLASPVHAATCLEFEQQITDAVRSSDPERAASAFKTAEASGACRGEPLSLLGRQTAIAFYARAFAAGLTNEEQTQNLERALGFGRPWQALAAMADNEKSARRYSEASALYQEALDDIRNERLNPQAPPGGIIASLVKKAEESRLLAPDYVRRVDRDGSPAGLACSSFRGFTVRRSALPIEFEYDSTTFTEKGRKAIEDLHDYLSQQGELPIRLIGHTDPRGTDVYNQALSERRAEAVKSFLITKGYKAGIRTSGKGRQEPFEPDNPASYTEEERWQLDRRVELDREGAQSCGVSSR